MPTRRSLPFLPLRPLGPLLLALLLPVFVVPASMAAVDDWPMFRGDAARTGSPFDQTSGGTGVVKWKFALVNESESSPAVARGRVFVGSDDGNLTAVWAANGTKNWTYDMRVRVTSSPAVADTPIPLDVRASFRWDEEGVGDLVVIGDSSGLVHAVKAYDGELWWRYATGGEIMGGPAIAGGSVFVASREGTVHAVSLDVGTPLWTSRMDGEIHGSPLVVGGRVYVGTWEGTLYALDAESGAVDWTFRAGARINGSPAYGQGTVVFGARDGRVHALDVLDGQVRWVHDIVTAAIAKDVFGSPAIRDGFVFVASQDEHLHALALDDGDLRWKARVKPTSSPAASGGAVFVGALGAVVALDPASGAETWRTAASARFDSSPAVVNGTLYIASSRIGLKQGADDHHLYALNAGDASPLTNGDGVPPPQEEPDGAPAEPDDGSPPPDEDEGGKESGENGLPLPGVLALAALALAALLAPRRRND